MKTITFIILVILLTINFLQCGSIDGIAKSRKVILMQKMVGEPKVTWQPTYDQLEMALKETQKYLENPTAERERVKKEIKNILAEKKPYSVQAWGCEKNKKKVIYLNFFVGDDFTEKWKTMQISVCDGGYHYWQVEIDIETFKVISLSINGYA